jgi:lauroyl/myristoyl acyltransferase
MELCYFIDIVVLKISAFLSKLKLAFLSRLLRFCHPKFGIKIISYFLYYPRFWRFLAPARIASDNYKIISGQNRAQLYHNVWRMKKVLEMAMYFHNPYLLANMRDLAGELEEKIADIRHRGKTPIMAPLHMCSDMLASVLCSMVSPQKSSVISIYQNSDFGPQEHQAMEQLGFVLEQINPLDSGRKMTQALRQAQRQEKNFVIYPDALPQSTWRLTGKMMPTQTLQIFQRQGRVHLGTERIARLLDAEIVLFYLNFDGQRLRLHIFDVLSHQDFIKKSAPLIEQALTAHPESWLLWHYPSLFYFNATN